MGMFIYYRWEYKVILDIVEDSIGIFQEIQMIGWQDGLMGLEMVHGVKGFDVGLRIVGNVDIYFRW